MTGTAAGRERETSPALRALLEGIIDYAGLFPPARLDLDAAVREYARHLVEPEAWMLARFIVPAGRLRELDAHVPRLVERGTDPLRLTVIVGAGAADPRAQWRIEEGFNEIRAFARRHGDAISVESVETRLAGAAPDATAVRRAADSFLAALEGAGLRGARAFLELTGGSHGDADEAALEGIAEARRAAPSPVGPKLRCGGLTAGDFPPASRIARVIAGCRDLSLPMKFTAGLHHPLRRWVEEVGAVNHGFLNVFGAGVLASASRLGAADLETCLLDDDASSFEFGADGFRWRTVRATIPEIAAARRDLTTGFGSCSFDEPREDLRALGFLS